MFSQILSPINSMGGIDNINKCVKSNIPNGFIWTSDKGSTAVEKIHDQKLSKVNSTSDISVAKPTEPKIQALDPKTFLGENVSSAALSTTSTAVTPGNEIEVTTTTPVSPGDDIVSTTKKSPADRTDVTTTQTPAVVALGAQGTAGYNSEELIGVHRKLGSGRSKKHPLEGVSETMTGTTAKPKKNQFTTYDDFYW